MLAWDPQCLGYNVYGQGPLCLHCEWCVSMAVLGCTQERSLTALCGLSRERADLHTVGVHLHLSVNQYSVVWLLQHFVPDNLCICLLLLCFNEPAQTRLCGSPSNNFLSSRYLLCLQAFLFFSSLGVLFFDQH